MMGILTRIALYTVVLSITIWSLPLGPVTPENFITRALHFNAYHIKPHMSKFMYVSGLWQVWNMFSHDPNLVKEDWFNRQHTLAINYTDGTKSRVNIMDTKSMSVLQKILNVRYQKYFDSANPSAHAYLIERFAQKLVEKEVGEKSLDSFQLLLRWKKIKGFRQLSSEYPETVLYDSKAKK